MIHLVFGESAPGGVKHAFRSHHVEVVGFPVDFSVGPIANIHKSSGITSYFEWAESSFTAFWGSYEELRTIYQQSLEKLLAIKDGESVTVWTCSNASEQIGLRIACFLLKDKQLELNFVNTSEAMQAFTKNRDVQIEIRHTGECNAEQLAHFFKQANQPISAFMRSSLEKDGETLLSSTSLARSWKDGKIVDEPESKDDALILECARRLHAERQTHDFMNAVRVIGEVIGHSEQPISDAWIDYRIRALIASGQLAYEGDIQSMRMYKIKVV